MRFRLSWGVLLADLIIAILAGIANFFLQMPGLQLTVAAAVLLIFSGYMFFDTSRLVRGGQFHIHHRRPMPGGAQYLHGARATAERVAREAEMTDGDNLQGSAQPVLMCGWAVEAERT